MKKAISIAAIWLVTGAWLFLGPGALMWLCDRLSGFYRYAGMGAPASSALAGLLMILVYLGVAVLAVLWPLSALAKSWNDLGA